MLNKTQLEEIEQLGALQFSIKECAIILNINLQVEMSKNQEIKNYYEKGRLLAVAEVRKSILTQAKNGSSPAQKQILDLMRILDNKISKNLI